MGGLSGSAAGAPAQSTSSSSASADAMDTDEWSTRARRCTCPNYRQPCTSDAAQPLSKAPAATRVAAPFDIDADGEQALKEDAHRNNEAPADEMAVLAAAGEPEHWTWDHESKPQTVVLYSDQQRADTVLFHPGWSNGTAAVRSTQPLNGTVTYWEVECSHRVFGTSIMFGVGTAKARLSAEYFLNLLGSDAHSWGISHKGYAWHNGQGVRYTHEFVENRPTVIGMLYDGYKGSLSYFKDGRPLGTAFTGLHTVTEPLYAMLSSTAARTEFTLSARRRLASGQPTLQTMCSTALVRAIQRSCRKRGAPLNNAAQLAAVMQHLPLPPDMRAKIAKAHGPTFLFADA